MNRIGFILVMALINGGCRQVVMLRNGIREPREESPESVRAFLQKLKLPAQDVYLFRDSSGFCRFMADPVLGRTILGTLLYDSRGLIGINSDSAVVADTGHRFQSLSMDIIPLQGDTGKVCPDCDYTLVITWAVFLGPYNDPLFTAGGLMTSRQKPPVRVIYLCIDAMKTWNLKENRRIRFRY
jgi:hypothetical protein